MTPDEMCPNCLSPWKCNGPHTTKPRLLWLRDLTNLALGGLTATLLIFAYQAERVPVTSAGMIVSREPFRCGCPAVNAEGREYEHCVRWYSDTSPVVHECHYKRKERK